VQNDRDDPGWKGELHLRHHGSSYNDARTIDHEMSECTSMSNEPDLDTLLFDVKRAIATAKIAEFEHQTYRVGDIVSVGLLGRSVAADVLLDAAVNNGLVSEHGVDIIQGLISKGFESGASRLIPPNSSC
jgi:hypothetical protein